MSNLFGEGLFLMARETEVVAGFFKQPFFIGRVRVVATCAAYSVLGRFLEGRVDFRLLKLLFLRRVACVTKLRAFRLEYYRADNAMAFVASFTFRFAHRRMDEFLRGVSLGLFLMAVYACLRREARRRRDSQRWSNPLPQERACEKYCGNEKRSLQQLGVHTVRPIHASVRLSHAPFPHKRPRLY